MKCTYTRWKKWIYTHTTLYRMDIKVVKPRTTAKTNEKNAQIKQMNRWRVKNGLNWTEWSKKKNNKNKKRTCLYTYMKQSHVYWHWKKVRMLKIKSILIHRICCKLHFFIRIFFWRSFLFFFCFFVFFLRISILWVYICVSTFFCELFMPFLSFYVYDRYDFLYKFCVGSFAYACNEVLTFFNTWKM